MALTYGFFDSINHDRTYNAEEFSSFLDGIVYDGVYESVGNKFYVSEYEGMMVTVDTGRAWFDHTFTLNTSKIALTVPDADTVYNRIDAVVLEVNKEDRRNYIKIVEGTPSESPQKPSLKKTVRIKQYALAYITVTKDTTEIEQVNIEYVVDTSETPLASALALAGIPSGGTIGQVLAKSSSESGAVGWYSIDHLPTTDWMHPNGVYDTDIIAAFQFKGAESETEALKSINTSETSYVLEKVGPSDGLPTWSAANGVFIPGYNDVSGTGQNIPGLNCDTLNSLETIGTFAIKYSAAAVGNMVVPLVSIGMNVSGARKMVLFAKIGGCFDTNNQGGDAVIDYSRKPGIYIYNDSDNNGIFFTNTVSIDTGNGVISANNTGVAKLYYNGNECALSNYTISGKNYHWIKDYQDQIRFIGQVEQENSRGNSPAIAYGDVYIHAAIFFNRILTDSEIKQLHENMLTI